MKKDTLLDTILTCQMRIWLLLFHTNNVIVMNNIICTTGIIQHNSIIMIIIRVTQLLCILLIIVLERLYMDKCLLMRLSTVSYKMVEILYLNIIRSPISLRRALFLLCLYVCLFMCFYVPAMIMWTGRFFQFFFASDASGQPLLLIPFRKAGRGL